MAITLTKEYQKLAEKHLGSISGYDDCYLRLYGKYNSQDVGANTTNYTLQMRIYNSGYWAQTGNCYAWISGTNYQNNTTLRFENGETIIGTKTETITHDDDGQKYHWEGGSFRCYAFSETDIGEGFYFPRIDRYPSFTTNPSVTGKTETTITFNRGTVSSNVNTDIYYSLNNKDWTITSAASTTITGLSAGIAYTIYVQARNHSAPSLTANKSISATTYKIPTQSLKSKTETSIVMNWSLDSTASKIEYSKDNGSTWTKVTDNANATSGSYTISGLSANTSYNIKTRTTRAATSTTPVTTTLAVTTYDYPYCTESPNFTIGNSLTLKFYNPLSRSISIKGLGADGSTIFTGTTTGTSSTGFNDSSSVANQYKSIPNAKSGKYKVQVTYGGVTKTRDNGNTYSIKGTELPEFSDSSWGYYDNNATIRELTGDAKILVNSLSNVFVSIEENKITIKNSATLSSVRAACGDKTITLTYNRGEGIFTGVIYGVTSNVISLTVVDSRGLEKKLQKTATWKNWSKPIILNSVISREGGISTKVLFDVNGTFWNDNFGSVANTIAKFSYRYKVANGTYSNYIDISDRYTITDNKFKSNANVFLPTTDKGTTPVNFEIGKEYSIQFAVKDKTGTEIYSNELILDSGIPCTAKVKKSDNTYAIGINKLPDKNYAMDIKGNFRVDGGNNIAQVSATEPNIKSDIWVKHSKNLFDGKIETGSIDTNTGNNSESTNFTRTTNHAYVKPNNQYILNINKSNSQIVVYFYSDNSFLGFEYVQNTSTYIFTTPNNCKSVRFRFSGIVTFSNPMLNLGNILLPYEPYIKTPSIKANNNGVYEEIFNPDTTKVAKATNADNATNATTATNANNVKNTLTNPTSATTYYPTFFSGNTDNTNYSARTNNGLLYTTVEGTTSAIGRGALKLGNQTSSGTAGNKRGELFIHSEKNGYTRLLAVTSQTSNHDCYLPQHNGYIQSSTLLYDNTSGSTGTITLNETSANFSYIDIYYAQNQNRNDFTRIYSPNGKTATLLLSAPSNSLIWIQTRMISINGTTISTVDKNYGEQYIGGSYSNNNNIKILRVLGWK